jgi:lysophosphatidic acid phosphatase type 6
VLPSDLNVTWDCDNVAAYAFSGFGTEHDKAPFQYANVVVLDDITIPPESPFASTHMWKGSCLTGQLTRVGAMQHRRLGAALRQIYVDKFKLLPATYDPKSVYIRSTGNYGCPIWRIDVETSCVRLIFSLSESQIFGALSRAVKT